MHSLQITAVLAFAAFSICLAAAPQQEEITVTGKLARAMAIGGESTGWAIELDAPMDIEGKQLHSIEVASQDPKKLNQLADKHVQANGKISHRQGVERGERTILQVSSIHEVKYANAPAFHLTGSEWRLEDLAGAGVIDNTQATLAFPEEGKVAGRGSCNRFFGPAKISGDSMQLGPLGATRMACPEAVMNQETKYLDALQKVERFEWKDPYLLLYEKGTEKPLRFTRLADKKK
ncbi:MAG TPA: META domain-containing protein [Bryobacteraceae bacterium]